MTKIDGSISRPVGSITTPKSISISTSRGIVKTKSSIIESGIGTQCARDIEVIVNPRFMAVTHELRKRHFLCSNCTRIKEKEKVE